MVKKKEEKIQLNNKLIAHSSPQSLVSEQYKTLRTNLNFLSRNQDFRSIAVTSAAYAEGKSTTSANLAIVYALEGKRLLLIDGDMRKPTLHEAFNMKNVKGLSSVLTQEESLKNAIYPTHIDNLDLLNCGSLQPNPPELLASKFMSSLLKQAIEMYDLVIIDTPPMLAFADSKILTSQCEGTLLVINSGVTEREDALLAKEAIVDSNSQLIGAVLNNFAVSKVNNRYQNGLLANS